jgi:hypothetical protein
MFQTDVLGRTNYKLFPNIIFLSVFQRNEIDVAGSACTRTFLNLTANNGFFNTVAI